MANLQDTIKILIQADAKQAITEIQKTGKTATTELDKLEKGQKNYSAQLTRVGAGMVAFSAVSAAALYKTAQSASDLAETVSKTNVVFGDAADEVLAFGDNAATSIGQSKQAALDAASTFGGLAKGIGLSADESADFSIKLTTLASDLASFGNTSPEEAVLALGSALRGESEPIRKYNVLLNEAAIKQEAYSSGIAKQGAELTEQQKVQARYNVILKQTSDAQGDFARTSDGAANQQRILSAQMKDLQANVGQGLLPIFTRLVSTANDVTGAFTSLSPATQGVIGKIAGIATIASAAGGSLLLVAGQASKLRDALSEVGDDGARSLTRLGKAAAGLSVAIVAVELTDALIDGLTKATPSVDRLAQSLTALQDESVASGALVDAFGTDLEDLSNELDKVNDKGFSLKKVFVRDSPQELARIKEAKADFEGLNDALTNLAKAGQADTAARSFLKLTAALREQGGSISDLLEQLPDYKSFLDDVADGTVKLTDYTSEQQRAIVKAAAAAGNSVNEYSRVTAALNRQARAHDDTTDAATRSDRAIERLTSRYDQFQDRLSQQRDASRDAAVAQLDVADSLAQVQEAQARYNELVKSGTATQAELSQAQRDVTRATIDYYGSVDDATQSVKDAASAQTGYVQGQENARGKTREYIAALEAQKSTLDGPVREALDRYINKIKNDIPASKTTKIKADTSEAESTVSAFERRVNGTVLTFRVNAEGTVTGPNGVQFRAAGGPVSAGDPYIVGEKGPELFVPGQSGSIVPNSALSKSRGGFGGGAVVVNFNAPVAGSKREFERMVANAIKDARRRGDRDVA